ncbi:hypothetical protein H8L32_18475 [Undibacterium sp. CY18W]|uniref:Uncharacterized protein n=1 Tax=Undibacterium hunanense TaxID=2762292 RepID=A0ABR6ZUB5_9BURK|nr:hypothetical protein [Undibacterium hunanense]MBC3919481.1 hypothetical protein [Undibacterium hunanense]
MKNYLFYVMVLLIVLIGLALILFAMNKLKQKESGVAGLFIFGPAYLILLKRNYKFTTREKLGWGAVFVLMLVVPLISHWLES